MTLVPDRTGLGGWWWCVSSELPHHLYRKRPRGEVGKRPLITSSELPHHLYRRWAHGEARVNFLTTYTEDGLVGKFVKRPLITSSELPHHLYRRWAHGEARVNFLTTYTEDGLVGKFVKRPLITSSELPHHLYRRRAHGEDRVGGRRGRRPSFRQTTRGPSTCGCSPRVRSGHPPREDRTSNLVGPVRGIIGLVGWRGLFRTVRHIGRK